MGTPPDFKDRSSDTIETLVNFVLFGLMISMGLGLVLSIFQTLSWEHSERKKREAKQNISVFNRLQSITVLENRKFAKTFDELAIGTLKGGTIDDSSSIFQYKLDIQSQDLAIIGAKPKDNDLRGANGAVLKYKDKNGVFATASIICQSNVAGADGTEPMNLPIVNTGKLKCAPNWKDLAQSQ